MELCHVLVSDECECCRYVSNAFSLLGLKLREVTFENLSTNDVLSVSTVSLFVCKNVEEKNKNQLIAFITATPYKMLFVLFSEPLQKNVYGDKLTSHLRYKFHKSELKKTLSLAHAIHAETHVTEDVQHGAFSRLIGHSKPMQAIRNIIKQVANCDATVLILGQSGTGKDVIASCIHHLSNRHDKPLVPINCGAIPSELMESELFGHEKGAFTGALTRRMGRFELADSGTLFLDEIGDMPFPMQVKLLRVIQDRKIERVGSATSINVDVRLIAATNKNLEELILQNKFREDLYYRLNVFPIHVPKLSERAEDIPLLIDYYLDKIHQRMMYRVEFTDSALEILCNYAWPGNIRELENFLERMVVMHRGQVLDETYLGAIHKKEKIAAAEELLTVNPNEKFNIKEYISNVEQLLIKGALERSNGIVSLAAEYLSLGRTTLIEKMKKYRLIDSKQTEGA